MGDVIRHIFKLIIPTTPDSLLIPIFLKKSFWKIIYLAHYCFFILHYDLFAIIKVLPTVPKIRFSCIFCTWFPLIRSDDKGHSIRWVTFQPALDKSLW